MKTSKKEKITMMLKSFLKSNASSHQVIRNCPKISIVTPSFNQKQFLERTICSVINQSYPNTEHIVIDGGSTDGTLEILKKYENFLSYWVSEADEGQTQAINKGLVKASGDLVAFQNSDDIYLPGCFRKVAEAYLNHPDGGVFYGNFLHIDEEDSVLDEQLLGTARLWVQIMLGPQIHNQAAFWRKEITAEIGLLDESFEFDMDYEYFSRILAAKYRAVHIPEFLGAFRHQRTSKTSTLGEVSKMELAMVAENYHRRTRFLRYVPRNYGRVLAMMNKAAVHVLQGRADYLLRDRIYFK
jgi:glycosyltransferase involved in cell wall biosynthesis